MVAYQTYMNGVNRKDAVGALANIRMSCCPRRYHRQYFFAFLLIHVGHGNVKTMYRMVREGYSEEVKKHNNNRFGFFGTFQYKLGKALIQGGLEMWKADRAGFAAAAAAVGAGGTPAPTPTQPHFKPKRRQVSAKTPQSSKHEPVNHKKGKQGTSEWKWSSARRRVMCSYLGINKRVWTECSGCKKPLCSAHFNGDHKGERWSHDSMSAASKSPSAVGE